MYTFLITKNLAIASQKTIVWRNNWLRAVTSSEFTGMFLPWLHLYLQECILGLLCMLITSFLILPVELYFQQLFFAKSNSIMTSGKLECLKIKYPKFVSLLFPKDSSFRYKRKKSVHVLLDIHKVWKWEKWSPTVFYSL